MRQRYFLYLAYDGTAYNGWQVQPNGTGVQQRVQEALGTLLQRAVEVTAAGRTDTGVHARQMVVHFDVEETLGDTAAFVDKLNRLLPPDVAALDLRPVRGDAHARFSATSRTYRYYICTGKYPFGREYCYRLHRLPDIEAMNRAAESLFDYIDFTSFSKLHTDVKTNNCRIAEARWTQEDERTWVFTITADRFLRNMVRAIVGTLLEVGRGKLSTEEFRAVIERRDRCSAGMSVPAQGLFLERVGYPEEVFINQ
jgi:tRNA pseudouridine38-40 synthase